MTGRIHAIYDAENSSQQILRRQQRGIWFTHGIDAALSTTIEFLPGISTGTWLSRGFVSYHLSAFLSAELPFPIYICRHRRVPPTAWRKSRRVKSEEWRVKSEEWRDRSDPIVRLKILESENLIFTCSTHVHKYTHVHSYQPVSEIGFKIGSV